MKRVAIYARASAIRGPLEVERQLKKLRAYCRKYDWEIAEEYTDGSDSREAFDQVLVAAVDVERRKFDMLLFWSLDHLPARNVGEIHSILQPLTSFCVDWRSHDDKKFDSHWYYDRHAILATLAAVQRFESVQHQISALKGVRRARRDAEASGEKPRFGSAPKITVDEFKKAKAALLKVHGGDVRLTEKLAVKLGVSRATAYRLNRLAQ